MTDKFSIHRSKYWQKETCHWKNHQSSNYHVSMLSGKRCETSKCVNTDYFISTSYQLYCEHQCLSVYSATSQLLQANILMWHKELSNLWQNHAHPLQKWSAKQILYISRMTDTCPCSWDRTRGQELEQPVSKACLSHTHGNDFQAQIWADREQRRRS